MLIFPLQSDSPLTSDQVDQTPSAEDIQNILPLLSPRQLADAIWGFAKQGHKPTDDFMVMVSQEVQSKLDRFR